MIFNSFSSGNGKSKLDAGGMDSSSCLDVHTELGSAQCQLALVTDASSNVPNEACVQATAPSGTQYFFSTTTGKIWKLASGTYSVVTANANTAHRGARYYNGYMYYWTATKLGRFTYDAEGTRNDSVGTASNSDFRASCEENLVLYITDGKYIASVDGTTFAANALDLPVQYAGTAIIPDGNTNILIGTRIGVNVPTCRTFLWDTYSASFTLSDPIPEVGVNCFIDGDDVILAQCGVNGMLYYWTGSTLALFENSLRGETTTIGHQMTTVLNSRPLIAVGNKIYSIYRKYAGQPRAIVCEYTATGAAITSICASGTQLYVSHGGVDKLSANRAVATLDTPEFQGAVNQCKVSYRSLPTGTSIGISTKSNGGAWIAQTAVTDTLKREVYFDGGLLDSINTQFKITLTPATTLTPSITNLEIL